MNKTSSYHTLGAIILAAGRGKRMQMHEKNKVTALLADKPIIVHIVEFMHRLLIETIVVVIGYAKESVIESLSNLEVIFAVQKEQLGTGDALKAALSVLPTHIEHVFVVYGDDAVLYTQKQRPIIEKLFAAHFKKSSAITFLTIEQLNPTGLGRIIRDMHEKLIAIVEEKDASEEQKKIREINPGCFIFKVAFLKKYLSMVEKSQVTKEYYLTSLIDLAIKYNEPVETVQGGMLTWRGVNTPEELEQAEVLIGNTNSL